MCRCCWVKITVTHRCVLLHSRNESNKNAKIKAKHANDSSAKKTFFFIQTIAVRCRLETKQKRAHTNISDGKLSVSVKHKLVFGIRCRFSFRLSNCENWWKTMPERHKATWKKYQQPLLLLFFVFVVSCSWKIVRFDVAVGIMDICNRRLQRDTTQKNRRDRQTEKKDTNLR